jgi:hypothetical protein
MAGWLQPYQVRCIGQCDELIDVIQVVAGECERTPATFSSHGKHFDNLTFIQENLYVASSLSFLSLCATAKSLNLSGQLICHLTEHARTIQQHLRPAAAGWHVDHPHQVL